MMLNLNNSLTLAQEDGAGIFGGVFLLIWLAALIVGIAGLWKTFEKAGKPGWAAIVPIYNFVVIVEVAGKPVWWFVLLFVPLVNFVVLIILPIEIAKKFGKGAGFGLGLLFFGFIFYPILGFGDARYQASS